jgi:hypothetical protein
MQNSSTEEVCREPKGLSKGATAADVRPSDVPDRGLLTRHSRCLGPYVLFVFWGRVSRKARRRRPPDGRLCRRPRRRLRREGARGWRRRLMARAKLGWTASWRGGGRRRPGRAARLEEKDRYNAAPRISGYWGVAGRHQVSRPPG